MKTRLLRWSEGTEDTEQGLVLDGLPVSFAELELAVDRLTAIEMGVPTEVLDEYEREHAGYGGLVPWLEGRAE